MNIRVPVSWLREYLKTDINNKTLASVISLSGPSVERIEKYGNDWIFDVEITSNRFDTASIIGLAREAHAILTSQGFKASQSLPKGLNLNLQPERVNPLKIDVAIRDQSLCPRFTAIVVENVKIKPSPAFIKNRLEACGIRPINNIVDISNYLMLELGQPMHTFDFDKIKGSKMILRQSRPKEKIKTLDKVQRVLPEGSIIIQDSERLIDLCGIMGGQNSQVSSRTKRVLIFVQTYNSAKIRKTTSALGFRTEASNRFEKGIDIESIPKAISRATYLAKQLSGAKIASELIDIYSSFPKPEKIALSQNKLVKYLGINMNLQDAEKILKNLGFEADIANNLIYAKPPSWRINDIGDDVDLIEEIARIYGYHNLGSKLPKGQVPQTTESDLKDVIDLKAALKYLGLTEIISYSAISQSQAQLARPSKAHLVELANPLTDNWHFMRTSLIPSLVEAVKQNQNIKKDLSLFEIAKTYIAQKSDLPKQDLHLSIVIADGSFYKIKGLVENVLEVVKRQAKWQKLTKDHALFENITSAQITIGDEVIGYAGIISSAVTDFFKIDDKLAATEINLTKLYQLPAISYQYRPIPKFPPVIEDISAIFAKAAPVDEIVETVQKTTQLVKTIKVLDIFEDKKLGENKKSVTLRLTFQKPSATLTQDEVNIERAKIIASLEKEFRAKIRK